MTALVCQITNAGRAAMVDQATGGTRAVRVTTAGFTAATFVVSPTLIALPGEFKRVASVSGIAADPSTLHFTIRDDSPDAYTVRGLALYLDDGTLFAVYGQLDAIVEKSGVSTFLVAADIRVLAGQAALVQFGDANFLNPPATEAVKGVALLASLAEALAGAVADKIISPAALSHVLERFVPRATLATPNGVATLGPDGRLTADQRPPIDLIDVFPVADQAAMLALAAGVGDMAVRSDTGLVYILQELPATELPNWVQLNTPAPVSSVNGKAGNVQLVPGDLGAVPATRSVGGTGLVTGGGALDADRSFNVQAASAAETDAGVRGDVALTPASIAPLLGRVGNAVPVQRSIGGTGLVTGGGSLEANRTLHVQPASADEILAGGRGDVAVTPAGLAGLPKSLTPNGYFRMPGGLIIQWVQYRNLITGQIAIYVPYPIAFPNGYLIGSATVHINVSNANRDLWPQLIQPGPNGTAIQLQSQRSEDNRCEGFDLLVIGW